MDLPVVPIAFVGLWFCGGPLSDLPPRWLLPVRGSPLTMSAVRRLCGDAELRPAAGQLLVVLVIHVQQLPWT